MKLKFENLKIDALERCVDQDVNNFAFEFGAKIANQIIEYVLEKEISFRISAECNELFITAISDDFAFPETKKSLTEYLSFFIEAIENNDQDFEHDIKGLSEISMVMKSLSERIDAALLKYKGESHE